MASKVIKKICLRCPKIKPHCHWEGRVYWLEEGQSEKEFTIYGSISNRYKNNKEIKIMTDTGVKIICACGKEISKEKQQKMLKEMLDDLPREFFEDQDHAVGGYISKKDLFAVLEKKLSTG